VKAMSERDDVAAAYYEDPEHRQISGPGRKRSGATPRLTTHVPIRFSSTVIERVKDLSAEDGKTVSSWIRDVIEQELLRRERTRTVGVVPLIRWERRPTPERTSSTIASSANDMDELQSLVG
jgi:hypothetical protein